MASDASHGLRLDDRRLGLSHATNDALPLLALEVAMLMTLVPVLAAGSRAAAP